VCSRPSGTRRCDVCTADRGRIACCPRGEGGLLRGADAREGRALHHVVHLLGLGDAAAADAAREVELRPERRLKVMFPDQGILLKSVRYD